MATVRKTAASRSSRRDPDVSALLDASGHPLRKEIDLLRDILLAADPVIQEGVKWNAASFRTTEWFATLNGPRHVKEPMIMLHAGAKAKGTLLEGRIADPTGMIQWLGKDRGMITFSGASDIKTKQSALQAIVRAWINII